MKLCAVIIAVMAMQELTRNVVFYVNTPEASLIATMALFMNFLLPMLIVFVLWFFPATIIGPVSTEGPEDTPGPDWALIAVTLVGLYVLIFGVIDLVYFEAVRIAERAFVDPERVGIYSPSPDVVAGRITNIIQIVIGFVLLAGKRGIARLITVARGRQ